MTVSVIIPVYNSATLIKQCINCVVGQSKSPEEIIIVVDSRSSDESIKESYMVSYQYPIVRVIIQSDLGKLGGARNLGIECATGDYIWFLDVDDEFSNTFIEEMTRIIKTTDSDLVSSNFYYSHKKSNTRIIGNEDYNILTYNKQEAIIQLNTGTISVNVWNKLFRSDFIKKNNIRFSKTYCEDYEFMIDCIYYSQKIAFYDKPLYTYVLSDNSLSSGKGNDIAERDVYLFNKQVKLFENETGMAHELCDSIFIHILHSMTNADYKTVKKLSNKKIIVEACKNTKAKSPEIILYKTNKLLFFIVGKTLRKLKFSKNKIIFNNG